MKFFRNEFRLILKLFARAIEWHLQKIPYAISEAPDAK
jgi:hypothetical protein